MTEPLPALDLNSPAMQARLRRRYRAERRFRLYGIFAIGFAALCLVTLLADIVYKAVPAFTTSWVKLDIQLPREELDPQGTNSRDVIAQGDFNALARSALQQLFPEASDRATKRALNGLLSSDTARNLRRDVLANPALIGQTVQTHLLLSANADLYVKGQIRRDVPESDRRLNNQQLDWLDQLVAQGRIERTFNWSFFTTGDSREPELAGVLGALIGSFYTMLMTLVLCVPVGVGAAIYLEEFAPKNRWTDLIEVNINNLAAVPSIVFGLLGLSVFLAFFGLPRSAPLVGGLVLALLVLPTIIIASRAALKAVPPSIREAALGVGASHQQAVFHHVLPLAMPGIMTGIIIGMAHALGETAPLLLIGMVAFIVDVPGGVMSAATALPVQVYLWSDLPEVAFQAKTAGAILVLLFFLFVMNGIAIVLRRRFERRW